jgi:FkbM family methyltransferase
MMLVSYAQNNEDIVLWRALRHISNGFYVDVGANDPTEDSITKLFYDRGWCGINIEPSTEYITRLRQQRQRDVNLACAVGDHSGSITFYDTTTRGWSTSDQTVGEHYLASAQATTREVELHTLDVVLERNVAREIHFLKIDVEGAEAAVLRGLNLARYRPWILIIEALDPISQTLNFSEWETQLLDHDYRLVYVDGLNRFYLAVEHSDLTSTFSSPPNVLDGFQSKVQFDLQARINELEASSQELKHAEATQKSRIDSLEVSSQALAAALAEATQNYRATINSWSWRITGPLRELNGVRKVCLHHLKSLVVVGLTEIKSFTRKLVVSFVSRLERLPRLKRLAVGILRGYPAVELRLRRLLTSHRLAQTSGRPVVEIAELVDANRPIQKDNADVVVLPLPVGKRVLYIYVDHTVSCPTNTGVQRVTRGLAHSLAQRGECVRYVKWDSGSNQCLLVNANERAHLARWNGPPIVDGDLDIYPLVDSPQTPVPHHRWGENHWLIVPEVTHITYQQRPVTLDVLQWSRRAGLKSGFVFYDAIPLRRKDLHDMRPKHALYMQQLLLADAVWPISDWSAQDLIAYWISHERADRITQPQIRTFSLPGESMHCARVTNASAHEQFILSVGSIEPRKNQVCLLRAFAAFREKHPDSRWRLTLVGNIHPQVANEVALAMRADKAVQHLGHVSDQDLDKLYRTCAFTVFPSTEEGFGLPILESLWYGKPCVCANFGAMAEVAQDGGCLTLDTRDAVALERAITRLISDDLLRGELATDALARSIKTWEKYAAGVCQYIEQDSESSNHLETVYYWIDATLQFSKNTGIQRVSRQLARALMETRVRLIPVKWDEELRRFGPVNERELAFFSEWNGPPVSMWYDWRPPAPGIKNSWFFMPDLPLNRSTDERKQLIRYAREMGLSCAAIFYDAIPWKMRKIYPPHFSEAHKDYMLSLGGYDLVLPISTYSKDDLVEFLGRELPRPQSLDFQIKALGLPGQFAESPRVTEYSAQSENPVKVLCVGTVEPRKNHETLLKAFGLIASESEVEIQLTIAGGSHSIEPALADRVRAFVASHPNIIWEEDANDARLRELHIECDFTVYPSIEEGFGLPILESLWYSKPCICANFGAMAEVAQGGGCIAVDVRDAGVLAEAIKCLTKDMALREKLSREATTRPFKTWQDYAREVTVRLAQATVEPQGKSLSLSSTEISDRVVAMGLLSRPKLSLCISTFNRAEWLSVTLKNLSRLYPVPLPDVEILVCDNASTDHTPDVIRPYSSRPDFSYKRNFANVGMLGNLRETAHCANGEYIWILGDDDVLLPGAIERVLDTIQSHPHVALIYLNYSFTRIEDARTIGDFGTFFREATPIVPVEADRVGSVRTICSRNENFFTAIYTLVFRRDHALKAYSQDTTGRPFSTMLSCIPTTYYVLNNMMEEQGVWIGAPQLVVNMNVSWVKYAPLWILERIPELYELAERRGVPSSDIDRWRLHTLPSVLHYFREIFENDPMKNAEYFSPARLVRRFKHLPAFTEKIPMLKEIYERAHAAGHFAAKPPPDRVFMSAETR